MDFNTIGTIIIGIAMLYGFISLVNSERQKESKRPLGCIATIAICIIIILFWIVMSV